MVTTGTEFENYQKCKMINKSDQRIILNVNRGSFAFVSACNLIRSVMKPRISG
jgi:hypothetical protein